MNSYSVSGKTTATAATIDNAIASLWNPSTTKPLYVVEVHIFKQAVGAADEPKLRRISARGTATTTATPTIENDLNQEVAPVTGALLDLAYSAQPTFTGTSGSGGDQMSAVLPATVGAGMMWVPSRPIRVKAGTGLSLVTGIALAFPVSRVVFLWDE